MDSRLDSKLLGKLFTFLRISVLVNDMIFLVFSSHISIGLWLGSLEIMDKKLDFVQQRPYNNMEDSFVTIIGKVRIALLSDMAPC